MLAAIASLVHDVLALCAVYAIFRIPLNASFIAAMLTIVGYSINNTIVIFDRIRGEIKYTKSSNMVALADDSLNATLSRTINTSLTTLIVVIVLYILGVEEIKILAMPLAIGIAVGTYSSVCIAAPA